MAAALHPFKSLHIESWPRCATCVLFYVQPFSARKLRLRHIICAVWLVAEEGAEGAGRRPSSVSVGTASVSLWPH